MCNLFYNSKVTHIDLHISVSNTAKYIISKLYIEYPPNNNPNTIPKKHVYIMSNTLSFDTTILGYNLELILAYVNCIEIDQLYSLNCLP